MTPPLDFEAAKQKVAERRPTVSIPFIEALEDFERQLRADVVDDSEANGKYQVLRVSTEPFPETT